MVSLPQVEVFHHITLNLLGKNQQWRNIFLDWIHRIIRLQATISRWVCFYPAWLVALSDCLTMCFFIYLSIYVPIHLSISFHLTLHPSEYCLDCRINYLIVNRLTCWLQKWSNNIGASLSYEMSFKLFPFLRFFYILTCTIVPIIFYPPLFHHYFCCFFNTCNFYLTQCTVLYCAFRGAAIRISPYLLWIIK